MGFFYDMKTCTKCKVEKELTEFNKDKTRHDGFQYTCKKCVKDYRLKNKKTINQYSKHYRLINSDKIKKSSKEYYDENKYKFKEYRTNNIDKIKNSDKEYRIKNKEKIKEYYSKNKKRINEYRKIKRNSNPLYKLSCNIRRRILSSLKNKTKNTCNILGCTIEEFKLHLENKFVDGMTWDNQGEWHLDHIYPVSLAKDEEELIRLNHYTNFQPLWALDNIRKSNKINN